MQALNVRKLPVFPPPTRTTPLDAGVTGFRPILSRPSSGESIKYIAEVRSLEKTKAQALEECRQYNTFSQLTRRYWENRYEAEQHGQDWEKPGTYVICQQCSDVGYDCELCYWAKVFEGTIKHERYLRRNLHEKLLAQIANPHRPCDLCDDFASGPDLLEERMERGKVKVAAAEVKSQLQDIHEMKMVAGIVQWLWEAEMQGLDWV